MIAVVVAAFLLFPEVTLSRASPTVSPKRMSPYSVFAAMTPAQLKALQVKLTYVGTQFKPVPTVAFTAKGNTLDLSVFQPYERKGIRYGNDKIRVLHNCSPTVRQLQALIRNVGKLKSVTSGKPAKTPFLSFALFDSVGGKQRAFEALVGRRDAPRLYAQIRRALRSNKSCLDTLQAQQRVIAPLK